MLSQNPESIYCYFFCIVLLARLSDFLYITFFTYISLLLNIKTANAAFYFVDTPQSGAPDINKKASKAPLLTR